MNARHRDEPTSAAERYGKHSHANADTPVSDVLQHAIAQGDAIRLAWRDEDSNRVVSNPQEFPTAVLPAVRLREPATSEADEDTEPMLPKSKPQQRVRPEDFSWWPKALAG